MFNGLVQDGGYCCLRYRLAAWSYDDSAGKNLFGDSNHFGDERKSGESRLRRCGSCHSVGCFCYNHGCCYLTRIGFYSYHDGKNYYYLDYDSRCFHDHCSCHVMVSRHALDGADNSYFLHLCFDLVILADNQTNSYLMTYGHNSSGFVRLFL